MKRLLLLLFCLLPVACGGDIYLFGRIPAATGVVAPATGVRGPQSLAGLSPKCDGNESPNGVYRITLSEGRLVLCVYPTPGKPPELWPVRIAHSEVDWQTGYGLNDPVLPPGAAEL